MAGFEELIRNALQKQGDPTLETRSAIYQSSRQALERMLAQNSSLDAPTIDAQRKRLEQAIDDIEKDYGSRAAPAVQQSPQSKPAPAPVASAPPPPPPQQATPSVAPQPQLKPQPVPQPLGAETKAETPNVSPAPQARPVQPVDQQADHGGSQLHELTATYDGDVLKERKPYAKMLLWVIILAGLGVALWWGITNGPALIKAQLDGSVPNPSETIESGAFNPEGDEGWVVAFSPKDDSTNIDSGGRGIVELFQDGGQTFARLASNAGSSRNNIKVKIPRGVMQPLQGKAATFELIMKNAADTSQQFAVFCEFADMGNCGRKRFKARKVTEAFIFDVLVNDVALPDGQDAYLAINTDLGGTGAALDLYSIRVRAEN